MKKSVKVIDLFAGIGATRIGFEAACKKNGIKCQTVFTSEIKPHAIKVYSDNFGDEAIFGDITKISSKDIPDFDFLLAGFPCQPFSTGGKRMGFIDTRGTLFFEIERILKDKKPYGFILENVEGLVLHDRIDPKKPIGRTLETILGKLNALGYKTNWKVLDSQSFGIPQRRKRIYIVGTKDKIVDLENFPIKRKEILDILEKRLPTLKTPFTNLILKKYSMEKLHGKDIKDKRGGEDNIHSWDIGLKGSVNKEQKEILNFLLKERRKKHWAEKKGMKWMDGMPLTYKEISSVLKTPNLKASLDDLVAKGYLAFEHPKDLVKEEDLLGNKRLVRKSNPKIEKGYNIVSGKLSFEFSHILDPHGVAPTLVATDVSKIAVPDGQGLRKLTLKEGMRLFGLPAKFKMDLSEEKGFDLLGNTVVAPVLEAVASRIFES